MKKIKTQSSKKAKRLKNPDVQGGSSVFEYPVFSFKHMRSGNFHIDECNKEQKSSLALKMSKIGQLTWQEIASTGRHGLGSEKISKESIYGDSVDFLTHDTRLIAFRFHSKEAMVGYRCSNGAFHILWLDRDFTLYKH